MEPITSTRKTAETDITGSFTMNGQGLALVDTGIGFFDHMLILFAKHGFFDLTIKAKGDLHVDGHHTVEDCGILLGQLIKKALGDKQGIKRYGSVFVPMDEALVFVSLDLSGRPFLAYEAPVSAAMVGAFDTELVVEFFRAVSVQAGITLHIRKIAGENAHHIIEAVFKAFGRALDEATQKDARIQGVMSSKGMLE